MANSCNACGLCCRLFYINLSKAEYESGRYKTILEEHGPIENFKLAKESGANLLAKNQDGSCVYLKDNKCSIHETRPKVCGEFFCTSKAKRFEGMVKIIKKADIKKESSVVIISMTKNSI